MKNKRAEYLEYKITKLMDIISEFAHEEEISFEDLYVIMTFALEGMSIELNKK